MFLQSLMLAAVDKSLATCPQAAQVEYPLMVKQELGYHENSILICGMALGYENRDAAINHFRVTQQLSLAIVLQWTFSDTNCRMNRNSCRPQVASIYYT